MAPAPFEAVDAVVLDRLGTLVDQLAGIRSAITGATGSSTTGSRPDGDTTAAPLDLWQTHVSGEQEQILDGRRPYAPSHALDAEAAALVTESAGLRWHLTLSARAVSSYEPAAAADLSDLTDFFDRISAH